MSQRLISTFLESETPKIESLPEEFLEFCRNSISGNRGGFLYTRSLYEPTLAPQSDDEVTANYLSSINEDEIVALVPRCSSREIAAVDTSTIKLGEYDNGFLCAIRVASVFLHARKYSYVRYGPLVFSINSGVQNEYEGFGAP
jgi:hypothetical protein